MNAYMNQYQNNQVLTANREQILIMLFDGAIRFVRQAKTASVEGRLGDKSKAISRAVAIITEFSSTLDFRVGGEIALDLKSLYDFILFELSVVNAQNDANRLDPIENILLNLREGFAGAIEINHRATQPPPVAGGVSEASRVAVSF